MGGGGSGRERGGRGQPPLPPGMPPPPPGMPPLRASAVSVADWGLPSASAAAAASWQSDTWAPLGGGGSRGGGSVGGFELPTEDDFTGAVRDHNDERPTQHLQRGHSNTLRSDSAISNAVGGSPGVAGLAATAAGAGDMSGGGGGGGLFGASTTWAAASGGGSVSDQMTW